MKWFLISLACVFCSASLVRGDAASDLFAKGTDALQHGDYTGATQSFDQIINNYPSTPSIDDVRLRAGFAYLNLSDFPKAIDRLSKETGTEIKPEYRGMALYYTGIAQLSQGGETKKTDKAAADVLFGKAAATLTQLIDYITATPSPETKPLMEDALYNRALAYFQASSFDDAEKNLLQLIQQYPSSLRRPDYLLLLGNLYRVEAGKATEARKPTESIEPLKALGQKAIAAFDRVSTDPNALVQANEANMSKGEVLYFLAQLDLPSTAGFQQALDAFRIVKRKDDMIPLQQSRVDAMKAQANQNAAAAAASSDGGAALNALNQNSFLIGREQSRLTELKTDPDPIIQALIRIAECYNALKQFDEARTILHRVAKVKLPADQQQEVDFQTIFSYALGGMTDKADAALTDYLTKHPGDSQADSISYRMAQALLQRKDWDGALKQAQRSVKDFPTGRFVAQAVESEAQAYTGMGDTASSQKVLDDFFAKNPNNPAVMQMLFTKAQNEMAQGDLAAALTDYQKVRDTSSGEMAGAAAAAYIQTLQGLRRYDDVIKESQAFAAKYPDSKALPGVAVMSGVAMDMKHDPAAVPALQAVAKQYPNDPAAPYALYFIVNIYQRAGPAKANDMIQAANDLKTAFPQAYSYLALAADAVSDVCIKQKKFDAALDLYKPLLDAPKADVAATAHNKTGDIWLAAAKSMGSYQSLQKDTDRTEVQKRLASAEQSYVNTLKNYPEQLTEVGTAFQGLIDVMTQRRSWGLLADADFETYLGKLTADLTSGDMATRVELAKAGLVFVIKDGDKQFAGALDRFKKALGANASLALTRQESSQFGELLIAGGDYPKAIEVYTNLLTSAAPSDQVTLADGYYGLGAAYLAQGDLANATINFRKMKKLNGGAAWHPHILDANYGLALAAEKQGDDAGAMQMYSALMRSPQASFVLQAKAILGYGRGLEKTGKAMKANPQDTEDAVDYYQQVDTLFGPAVPALSAEGLYDAGQAYDKANDKVDAQAMYKKLIDTYGKTAPDWAAKAQAAVKP